MTSPTDTEAEDTSRAWAAGMWAVKLDEGGMSEAEISEWISWCERDQRNLAAFEEMQSLWSAATKYPPQASSTPKATRKSLSSWRRIVIAASIAAISTVAFSVFHRDRSPEVDRIPVGVGRVGTVETKMATNQKAILPDGSRVEVGARSVLDVDFSGGKRELKLREGQAYFQVEHDPDHPFVVEADLVRVVAIGTAFDVSRSLSEIAITVQEGTVKVFRINGDAHPVKAEAGYQLVFDKSTGKMRRSIVDPSVAMGWREGRLEFTGDKLDVVIASVNRYAPHRIVLQDPELGNLVFTGTVFVDSIDSSLDAMQQVFALQIQRTEHEVILTKRR